MPYGLNATSSRIGPTSDRMRRPTPGVILKLVKLRPVRVPTEPPSMKTAPSRPLNAIGIGNRPSTLASIMELPPTVRRQHVHHRPQLIGGEAPDGVGATEIKPLFRRSEPNGTGLEIDGARKHGSDFEPRAQHAGDRDLAVGLEFHGGLGELHQRVRPEKA